MKEATITRVLKRIEERKCLVILGPELLCESSGSINLQLNKRLSENFGNKVKYYAEEEFLNMTPKVRLMIEDDIRAFYEQLQPTDVYRQIAEIPFSMIINTAPDKTLNKTFEEKKLGFDYDYYRKYEAPQEIARKNKTLIYNIFGDYTDINSMILTFDDLFEYLFNIMGDNELKIKSDLRNATAVLFFGFSFDKWYFKLLLRLMQVNENKLLHSHDIKNPNVKNFFTEEFEIEFFEAETATEIIAQIHQQAKLSGMIQEPVKEALSQSEIFVSYAEGGESEEMVNKLDKTLQENGILILRDKRDMGFKGLISEFMNRIGKGKGIVLVVSDKYLKSPYCMYELLEIHRNLEFKERIFPIVMGDANIFEPLPRLQYLKYWRDKKDELDMAIKEFGADAITVIGEDYKIYKRVFDNFGEVVNILKDINSLTPDMHRSSDFEALVKAVKEKM